MQGGWRASPPRGSEGAAMTEREFFERAAALGVVIPVAVVTPARDLEWLLEAVHSRESELMLLRHAIIRRLAQR
jgi:hypothetical protein